MRVACSCCRKKGDWSDVEKFGFRAKTGKQFHVRATEIAGLSTCDRNKVSNDHLV